MFVMKNSLRMLFFLMLSCACSGNRETTFELLLPLDDGRTVDLETVNGRTALEFVVADSSRKASFVLPLKGGEYARVWIGDLPLIVWVEAGKPWIADLKWKELHFKGAGADINNYLSTRSVHQINYNDYYRMGDDEFRGKLQRFVSEREKILRERKFDPAFSEQEMKRIKYMKNYHLASFVIGASSRGRDVVLSEDTFTDLKNALVEDSTSWGIPEYPESIKRVVYAFMDKDKTFNDSYALLLNMLKMTTEKYKDKRLVEYVVNKNVMEYVRSRGMENTGEMDRVFRTWVQQPEYIAAYNEAYEANKKLFEGQPAIPFTLQDITGKKVSLSDLRGKYVYIDMWATWCGPCRAEIPHLEKLEKRLKGKNIYFVSISCDYGEKEWKDYVKSKKLGGIQLYLGYDEDFMKAILCNGIPRFMLIDREGNYIRANMTRPSMATTLETLEALPGI